MNEIEYIHLLEFIKNPLNIFKNNQEVVNFVNIEDISKDKTLYHLRLFLDACVENECFEWCSIISEKIKEIECRK